ncbi:MAG: hypothetical protein IPK50_16520 [Fibrobacterota bacterium]|nr:MAG: hypothetical protein IPK50_16520 [Fibrobacterota bacterium]
MQGETMTQNEVFNLLGKNLAIFQKIEILAKAISEAAFYYAKKRDQDSSMEDCRINCENFPLGRSIPEYLKIFDQNNLNENHPYLELKIKFTISEPACGIDAWRLKFKEILDERNWLVHKSLIDLDLTNEVVSNQWISRLERQYDAAISVSNEMEIQYKLLAESRRDSAKFMTAFAVASLLLSDKQKLKQDQDGWILFHHFEYHYDRISSELFEIKGIAVALSAKEYIEITNCETSIKKQGNSNALFIRF